jgi:hypothetical protein
MPTCSGRSSWCTSPPDRPPTTAPCAGRRPGRLPSVGECAAGTARCCDNRPNSQATRLPCRRVRIRIPAGERHGDGRPVVCPVRSHGQELASRQGPMGRRVEWTAPKGGTGAAADGVMGPRIVPWPSERPTLSRSATGLGLRSAGVDVSVCGGCIPRSVRRLHIAGSAVSRETAGHSERDSRHPTARRRPTATPPHHPPGGVGTPSGHHNHASAGVVSRETALPGAKGGRLHPHARPDRIATLPSRRMHGQGRLWRAAPLCCRCFT